MKTLDFLIIGAQKCATTALFEHLRYHPDIVMPLEKELPFFTREDCSKKDWSTFSQAKFNHADESKLWGKASPQYMCDPNVPERIKAIMPNIKLVAILRDPIDRTRSHYQMGKRRDTEQRSFAEAIKPLVDGNTKQLNGAVANVPDHTEGYQSEEQFYVSWSEYGRVLSEFSKHFKADQILILYTEDLESKPQETLDQLLMFIGLPTGFCPPSLGKIIHRGGSKKRIPQSVREWFRQRSIIYWLWQCLPEEQRGRLRFKYEQWNIQKKAEKEQLPAPLLNTLRERYSADLQLLLTLPMASSVTPPPWIGRYLDA